MWVQCKVHCPLFEVCLLRTPDMWKPCFINFDFSEYLIRVLYMSFPTVLNDIKCLILVNKQRRLQTRYPAKVTTSFRCYAGFQTSYAHNNALPLNTPLRITVHLMQYKLNDISGLGWFQFSGVFNIVLTSFYSIFQWRSLESYSSGLVILLDTPVAQYAVGYVRHAQGEKIKKNWLEGTFCISREWNCQVYCKWKIIYVTRS